MSSPRPASSLVFSEGGVLNGRWRRLLHGHKKQGSQFFPGSKLFKKTRRNKTVLFAMKRIHWLGVRQHGDVSHGFGTLALFPWRRWYQRWLPRKNHSSSHTKKGGFEKSASPRRKSRITPILTPMLTPTSIVIVFECWITVESPGFPPIEA